MSEPRTLDRLIERYRQGGLSRAEVLAELERLARISHHPPAAGADPSDRGPDPTPATVPLTATQQGLWALQRARPRMTAYNVPLLLQVRLGDADASARLRAVSAWLGRHWPILAASVRTVGTAPMLSVQAGAELPLEWHAAEGWSDAERLAWLRARVERPFDPGREPLARLHLLEAPAAGRASLLFVGHHIVVDGRSRGLIAGALRQAWDCLLAGRPLPAPVVPAVALEPYRRAVAAERERLAGAEGARRLAFWCERLAGLLEPLDLPLDRPRAAERSYAGASAVWRLPDDLAASVRDFARGRGLYSSTVLLCAWQALLARLGGRQDLVVGMPLDERDGATADLVGLFITMLPIRSPGFGARPMAEALQRLQRGLVDAMANVLPFPALVRGLGLGGESDRDPVFQSAFFYQLLDWRGGLGDGDWSIGEGVQQQGEYELSLDVVDAPEGFELHLKYDPDLYDETTILRWTEHYLRLLAGLVADPERPLSALPLLGAAERDRLLADWGRGPALTAPALLPEAFARQAAATPEAPAVRCGEIRLSYGELEARNTALAARLAGLGIGRGDVVGLCLERSEGLLVGLLGILRSGAAYLPLDPGFPAARLELMLADSSARLVVCDAAGAAVVGGTVPTLRLDEEQALAGTSPPAALPVLSGEDPAYLIYTSGSTGRPKGVLVPHHALAAFLAAMVEAPGLSAGDRLLAVTTVSFDIAALELFLPLTVGAEVLVCPAETARDGQRLAAEIARLRPTVMQATPAAWTMLFHAGWRNAEGLRVLCGGEALPPMLKARFEETGTPVWNLFGPTETTIWSTLARLEVGDPITIGEPIAGTQAYVLDAGLSPQPVGVAGELYLAGAGLAHGYRGRPGLTASAFLADPYAAEPGGRMYRTGDLARWRADGSLEYLGRADRQLKLRGYRIEPGEIEARLESHPSVRRAAVVAQAAGQGRRLVAWCEACDGASLDPDALRRDLAETLPAYMVPEVVTSLDALPLTPNGKLDRKALAERRPEVSGRPAPEPASGIAVDPVTEARIAGLWHELLGREAVGRDEGFFRAGGDSVSAVLLAERLGEAFGRPVAVSEIFRHPTIAAQAVHLGGARTAETAAPGETPAAARETDEGALAIVGIACRFPGAPDHRAFWRLLREGRDAGRRFTPEELRAAGVPEAAITDPRYVPVRHAIEGRDLFDAGFFGISPRNAARMDPQFRLLLENAWAAIEDAGRRPEEIPDTAVFMATGASCARTGPDDEHGGSERYVAWLLGQPGTLSTTISYQLGLTGPSYAVHANCSSSLVALHAAAQAIRSGEARQALVGACTLFPEGPPGYLHEPGLNFASDGRCKAFDAAADGLVPGEGVAVLLVKRAADAIADGDPIYALIRGVAVNNDGADKAGYYAPSVRGQAEVIARALALSGVDPATIGYLEAHGTGTALGDPVEIAALAEAWGETGRRQHCAIGSVKSNLGHLDTAAGLAGLIKAALCLGHGEIVPTLHYERPSPRIDFAASPFHVADRLEPWPEGPGPRRAAVSAFGIGGTNAHAVLEQAPVRPEPQRRPGPQLVVLSARSLERLRAAAGRLAAFLEEESPDLADLAWTLQVGRQAMVHRLALVVEERETLCRRLAAFAEGREDEVVGGVADAAPAEVDCDGADQDRIAQHWVQGGAVDWERLHPPASTRRIVLPTYPFAPEHVAPPVRRTAAVARALHPLAQRNSSDFAEQRFTSRLTGEELFLRDHVMAGRRVLPGVAHLEMVRAALAETLGRRELDAAFADVVWIAPVEVDGALDLLVALAPGDRDVAFEIYSLGADGERQVHSQGRVQALEADEAPELDIAALASRMTGREETGAACYAHFATGGADYGPTLRSIERLRLGEREALARLVLPESLDGSGPFRLHPSLLDGAVQAAFLALDAARAEAGFEAASGSLPFELAGLEAFGPCVSPLWAWVRSAEGSAPGNRVQRLDLDLCEETGRVCVRLRGLARLVAPGRAALPRLELPVWVATSASGAEAVAQRQALFCGLDVPGGVDGEHVAGEGLEEVAVAALARLRELARARRPTPLLVQLVVPALGEGALLTALAGLAASVRIEHPKLPVQVIAVDPAIASERLAAILAQEAAQPEDRLIRHVSDAREVAALEPVREEAEAGLPWCAGGVYLLTGGLGRLGRIFAREILERAEGARVVLLGRSALDGERRAWLEAQGGRAEYRQVDVTDAAALKAAVAEVTAAHGRLDGVLHAAGVLADSLLVNKTETQVRAVLAPKLRAALALDEATAHLDLELFVLFSSVSALGSLGQADYALANAFLDALAERREALAAAGTRRGRSLSIAWPLWRDGGMHPDPALQARAPGLSTEQGLACFYRALAAGGPRVVVQLAPEAAERKEAEPAAVAAMADPGALEESLRSRLLGLITELVGVAPEDLDPDEELDGFGFDSISLTNLANRLNADLGLRLTPAVFFEHATVNRFLGHLLAEQRGALPVPETAEPARPEPVASHLPAHGRFAPAVPAEPAAVPAAPGRALPVAVIGMSGRFPMAADLEAFWRNLLDGRDCIREVPPERWDWRAIWGDPSEPGRTDVKWGGFIEGMADFDPLFFGLSPREAECMDPQQRLLMTHAWLALEDAGYPKRALAGSDTALFVGMGAGDYGARVVADDGGVQGHTLLGLLPSMAPARVSHFMDWHGPSELIDTACSSSLVAVHQAVRAIAAGDCGVALAGGVMAMLSPTSHLGFSKAGMLSRDGRCKTFSDAADGYARGEGVGMLVLKRLDRAEADGDRILGVIRGSAVNHGGRSNSLTAPNARAQAELIETACRSGGIDPRDIGYIEAHGTGTRLGDPVEVNGLKSAFRALDAPEGADGGEPWCALGAVKTNIGHLETAAGIAGLIKVLLQLHHRTLVPSLHCERVNPYLELERSPFYLLRESRSWTPFRDAAGRAKPRLAGVSSFGFGGVNAHVLIEEHRPPAAPTAEQDGPAVIVLSAKGEAALQARARDLLAFLETRSLGGRAEPLAEEPRNEILTTRVCGLLAEVLGVAPDQLAADEPFESYGLDALGRTRLAEVLRERLGLVVPAASLLRAICVAELVGDLVGEAAEATPQAPGPPDEKAFSLQDLAWTLQIGREPMERRLAFVAGSLVELREKLRAAAAGGGAAEGLYRGHVRAGRSGLSLLAGDEDMAATVSSWIAKRKHALIARLWAEGLEPPWPALHAGWRPRRIGLPLYAFEPRPCWIDPPMPSAGTLGGMLPAAAEPESPPGSARLLAPVWDAVVPERAPLSGSGALVVGVDEAEMAALRAVLPEAQAVAAGDSIERLAERLHTIGSLDRIIVIAPPGGAGGGLVALLAEQRRWLQALFRLAKAVLAARLEMRALDWTLVTTQAQDLGDGRAVHPAAAGLHGFLGALAREFPHWRVRLLDRTADEPWDWAEALTLAADAEGATLCRRDGRWQRQRLLPVTPAAEAAAPAYRDGGVYLIVGGAGGLGRIWSRHLVERHQAQLVWIGRRAPDPEIRAGIEALAALGPAPLYLQADARDAVALRRVRETVLARFGRIDGVVHAALALADRSLARMSEAELEEAFGAKAGVAVALAQVFAEDRLDFLLLFSSTMSFGRAAGQSNYAAGCVFQDAFARLLARQAAWPVKVVNWGWWGGAGAVTNAGYRARMIEAGLASIEPAEGLAALETLLGGPFDQLALVKTAAARPAAEDRLLILPATIPALAGRLGRPRPVADAPHPEGRFPDARWRDLILGVLAARLAAAGKACPAGLEHWLAESRRLLAEHPVAAPAHALEAWDAAVAAEGPRPELALLDRCLKALPELLADHVRAPDVLFPDGSPALVEAIYADNPVAGLFNDALAALIAEAVEARLREDPGAGLRILEIGAGTGASSAGILTALRPFGTRIAEYAFTDLSRAFLLRAEERFAADYPFLRTQLFDVERAPAWQGLATGGYDLVIAVNVLHATADVGAALRNAKALLRRDGLLLLSDLAGNTIFTHLTFGLLDGWWRFRDAGLRQPGGPALAPEGWRRALAAEGFRDVGFPLEAQHALGQQLVVAASDGVVRLDGATRAAAAPPLAARPLLAATPAAGGADRGVAAAIREELARTLKIEAETIEPDVPFSDYGVDSILGIGFVKALCDRFDLPLSQAVLFEHSTLDRLTAHLAAQGARERPAAVPAPAVDRRDLHRIEIAVVGMAAQVPGATDVESFWRNLMTGAEVVGPLPDDYCEPAQVPAASRPWGGVLAERACFDPQFFNISPREAKSMSPHQRLVLLESWKALEDAAIDPKRLAGSRVGCFVGAEPAGYFHETFTGSSDAIVAARLSYLLDLEGPALAVNTGCSSSGTALHLACESLRRGECHLALAGGVYAALSEPSLASLAQLDMLSPSGRCHSFDARADGTVFSEAVGMVVLKRLDEALRDGDPIHGVIVASALNHDGASNGLTAPNGAAQERLLVETYHRFGIDPARIGLLEAHGTGTRLGDPVEANALVRAFRHFTDAEGTCALGSAKAHVGHAAAAAGVIGLIKLLLSLEHGQVPALQGFERLNPLIELAGSPFVVPTAPRPWPTRPGEARIAALNSFGHSGTNVHLVVRSHETPAPATAAPDLEAPFLLPLSAANEERLRACAETLLRFLQGGEPPALRDIAHTLQAGRAALKRRVCFSASDIGGLRAELAAFAGGAPTGGWLYGAAGDEALGSPGPAVPAERLEQARRWLGGEAVDWSTLYRTPAPRRVRLPAYPFAKTRFWAERPRPTARAAALHPLVQENRSGFGGLRFAARFDGSEPCFADHVVQGRPALPGVAYLEMARAAFDLALPDPSPAALRLRGVAWVQPLVVGPDGTSEVTLELEPEGGERARFEVRSGATLHCRGKVERAAPTPAAVQDLEALRARMGGATMTGADCYARFGAVGFAYGPSHRGIRTLHLGRDEALAELTPPAGDAMLLPPGLLDSAVQATVGLAAGQGPGARRSFVPFALEQLSQHGDVAAARWAWVRRPAGPAPGGDTLAFDIDLLDEGGRLCLRLAGFTFRALEAAGGTTAPEDPEAPPVLLWRSAWRAVPAKPGTPPPAVVRVVIAEPGWGGPTAADLPVLRIEATLDADDPAPGYQRAALALFDRLRQAADAHPEGLLLQVVVPSSAEGTLLVGLSGLLRTAALELPRLSTQLIELDAPEALERVLREYAARPQDQQVRYRDGQRLLPDWQELEAPAAAPVPWRDNGVYLVTGGLGGLGLILAREIVAQAPAATLVLCGRSAVEADDPRLVALRAGGARVVYRQADVADAAAVETLVGSLVAELGGLQGVIHAAGLLRDAWLRRKTHSEIAEVLAPKVAGACNLDRATRVLDLDLFVLFAAAAGAFGNPGQLDYAAANGFLDAFAIRRNAQVRAGQRRGHTLALDWPLWANGGMGVDEAVRESLEAASGMVPLQDAAGLEALYRAIAAGEERVLVAAGPPARLRAWIASLRTDAAAAPAPAAPTDRRTLLELARGFLVESVAETLHLAPAELDPRDELSEYGFDSITFTELTNQLNRRFGLDLVPTVFFEYPTIEKLAAFLAEDAAEALTRASGTAPAPARSLDPVHRPAAPRPLATGDGGRRDVAIVGMSGRFPGAPDLEGFWQMLSEWRDCIGEVPEDRWRWRDYWGDEPGRTRVKEAGFIEGLAEFDPLLFGISPAEALLMDPQQRLFLTHAWAAIEDAGYAPSSLAGGDTAIFVGTAPSGYAKRIEQADVAIDGYSSTGSVASVGPSRLSYLLDLHGPSEPVETACSSALVAVHRAVEAIRHGRCETALAGGVNAIVLPEVHVAFDKAGMLSPDGRCKTFSARADGYGRGEGVGILFLKELAAAERDGDPIHAVIRGSAVNHGGRAGSLTAPNPRAQASLIEAAVRDAGVEPSQIGYVETHGTGTALGDPIEIEGLTAAFRALHAEAGTAFETAPRCALGSVKSNIGHLELAAGAAGLIKAVLQLKHGHLVRSLHCEDLNPYIRLEGTPFEIAREDRSWPAPRDVENRPLLRVAGVSSFGFGGVNAHVVLEEYPEPERSAAEASEGEPVVVVLSARDGERLAEAAHNLLAVIRREHRPCLRDLAYTLQLGRQAFAERLAFEAASYEALQDTLGRFLADGAAPGLHRGRARHDSRARALFDGDEALAETLRGWLARRKTAKLMALWVEGIDVDWAALHDGEPSRRVRLPTYPFARERYWIVPPAGAGEANNKVVRLTAAQPARAAGEEDFHGALLDRLIAEELSAEEAIRLIRERPA